MKLMMNRNQVMPKSFDHVPAGNLVEYVEYLIRFVTLENIKLYIREICAQIKYDIIRTLYMDPYLMNSVLQLCSLMSIYVVEKFMNTIL